MDKRKVIQEIQSYLAGELAELLPEAEAAEASGTELPEDVGQRIGSLQQQLTLYKFLPVREYGKDDVVCPASLVELELRGRRAFYLIVPTGGGLILNVDAHPVQVITPQSPLGEAVLGRRVGESFRVQAQSEPREYRIVSLR